jgi:hypothetical protein
LYASNPPKIAVLHKFSRIKSRQSKYILIIVSINCYIVTMTKWSPALDELAGPRYVAIADALAADISNGRLPAGTRLPTHRDLAWELKVTVGTVSRAYAEAERRGLIYGEVGHHLAVRARGGAELHRPGL